MIISLGEALIDFISLKKLDYKGFPGGSPYNTSIAISRQGIPCQFIGRMSKDIFGVQLLDYLKENQVGTDFLISTDDPTTLSFVQKESDGKVQYAFFSNGTADRFWSEKDINNLEFPKETKIIHFGSISLTQEPCGSLLTQLLLKKASGILLSFDPNIRPSLVSNRMVYMERFHKLCKICSIVKLSDEDLEWLFPDETKKKALSILMDAGVSLIALTEGKAGARLITRNESINSPLYDLPVADTVGAGDTFHGALLSFLYQRNIFTPEEIESLSDNDLKDLGIFANKAAGINCHRSGANPPTSEEMVSKDFTLPD
jgi:fructokinase